jgi:hypothetical protein
MPQPGNQIATIVHLTDLHLFVDEHGGPRSMNELSRLISLVKHVRDRAPGPIAGLATAVDKMATHHSDALIDLEEVLRQISAAHDPAHGPLIIAHTGDVEVIGPRWYADGTVRFLGLEYIEKWLQPAAPNAHWAHVYGNHDVWPGGLPITDTERHLDALAAIGNTAIYADSYPSEPLQLPTPHGPTIRVHRVNTVPNDVLEQTAAHGRIGTHPHGDKILAAATSACLAALAVHTQVPAGKQAVDIVLMHHPPHAFRTGPIRSRIGAATMRGHNDFAAALANDVHAQLVIAGHRHHLDPNITGIPIKQHPLPASTLQLVAESPTASPAALSRTGSAADRAAARTHMSFSTYHLYSTASDIDVARSIWRRSDIAQNGFVAGPEHVIARVPA